MTVDGESTHVDVADDNATGSTAAIFKPLPQAKFLSTEAVVDILLNATVVYPAAIPPGRKDNAYVLADNGDNVRRRGEGQHIRFADDCGVWSTEMSSTTV